MKNLVVLFLLSGCASNGGKYTAPPACDGVTDVVISAPLPQPTDLQDLVRRRHESERRARCKAQED
jgi:hypothetical protein